MTLPRRVLITGAAGNLGRKLAEHLRGRCELTLLDRVGLERMAGAHRTAEDPESTGSAIPVAENVSFPPNVNPPSPTPHAFTNPTPASARNTRSSPPPDTLLLSDLSVWHDSWTNHFAHIDAVVHLAGNPVAYHDWPDLLAPNIDATLNVFAAAAQHGVRRLVFASSNHVMGGYQDSPDIPIRTDLPPRPGTRYQADGAERSSAAYGATKLFGEQLGRHYAARGMEVVAIRLGWVWKGNNVPADLPAERGDWFRDMWLSDRDYLSLMERALSAPLKEPFTLVNGMSHNEGMRWDLTTARQELGYNPQDNVRAR